MELVAPRRTANLKGGAIAAGACLLSLALSARLQALTGNSGMLLTLLISAAIASWYAGRWAGLLTTGIAVATVAYYLMPPDYSFRISDPHDTAALSSFAIGGVIISLLCGAAWQLRLEAESLRQGEAEMVLLRSRNSRLALQSKHDGASLAASDQLLRQFARSTRFVIESGRGGDDLVDLATTLEYEREASPAPVDCSTLFPASGATLPTVWADETELKLMFDLLVREAARTGCGTCLEIAATQLPEWWLFVAVFRAPAEPLTRLQFSFCERVVIRQGGRCWANATLHGDWELRFLLRRIEGAAAEIEA